MMKLFSQMDEVERLELARGNPPPKIELTRHEAEKIIGALAFAGQHTLASMVKEKLQWVK